MRQMPSAQLLEIEGILDTQVARRTPKKEYLQYLVKWKNCPIEDSSWVDAGQIQHVGYSIEELMGQSHELLLAQEPDVGASNQGQTSLGV